LNAYSATQSFPRTQAELDAALSAAGLSMATLQDAWGHALYVSFRTRSLYTDRVSVEARARVGETPQKRTTVTPATEVLDSVDLHSMGPDGLRGEQANGYDDDFVVAILTHVRTQQTARDAEATVAAGAVTQSGEPRVRAGAIDG